MIFRRALMRELTTTAAALFVVLLAILFTNLVLRVLGRAAGGSIAVEGVATLVGFYAVYYVPVLLSVTVFLTVLLALSRSFRDSEMIVWFTSGRSLTAWMRPILIFAVPFIVVIGITSLYLSPWALSRQQQFERQLEARDELSFLTPGLFKEFRRAGLVVFIESINTFDNTIRNVFVQSTERERDITLIARSGRVQDEPNGDRFIVLRDGRRYDGTPGKPDFRIFGFDELARRIEPNEVRAVSPSVRAETTAGLIRQRSPQALAELFWRLATPVSGLILVLLAIPLSYVNPRMGRSFNLIAAVLIYMIYNNCISIVQSWIAQERLTFAAGLMVTHGIAAMLTVLMFWRRLLVFSWSRQG